MFCCWAVFGGKLRTCHVDPTQGYDVFLAESEILDKVEEREARGPSVCLFVYLIWR